MNTYQTVRCRFAVSLAGCLLVGGAALAQPVTLDAQAQSRFRQEMAMCDSGQSGQPLSTCRTEARNAQAEAKRGGLTAAGSDAYVRNAVRRCVEFQGDDRAACEARVLRPSRIEGSVRGGGLLRESIVTVPVQ
jgi:hypothetical protein